MGQPSQQTIKRLFAASGNICAYPSCNISLIDENSGKVTGRICHIKGRSIGGPRYDPAQSEDERHGYDNLLLMCPIHHDVIDSDITLYTVDRLWKMKAGHEKGRTLKTSVSHNVVDKYIKTLVEFWLLSPRGFLDKAESDPGFYLSPSQFFFITVGILTVLYIAMYSFYEKLPVELIERYPLLKLTGNAEATAIREITILVFILVYNSVFIKIALLLEQIKNRISLSKIIQLLLEPMKSRISLSKIMYFQFYLMAIILPFAALDLLLTPILLNYVSESKSPYADYLMLIPFAIGSMGGLVLYFIYHVPGLAKICEVSSGTFFFCTNLLAFVVGFYISAGISVYSNVSHRWELENQTRTLQPSKQSVANDRYNVNIQTAPITKPNPQSLEQKTAFAKAEMILARIHRGEDFATLAKRFSDDPASKDKGGEYDFFPHGWMIPEFEKAAFSLNSGEVSDIVETRYGYDIIKVEGYKDRGTPNEKVRVRHILIAIQPHTSK